MLERLYIEATETTPRVFFDKEESKFIISGRSLPEDTESVYEPIMDWLNEFEQDPNPEIEFEINFDYYNSTSLKKVVDILVILKRIETEKNSKVVVVWYYEDGDESSYENGEDLCYAVDLPIKLKVREE
ncbi:MAG: DUF1987 domain-containing protein [Bacteroidales bacterium]|jgi:hypothetical protein|nr:DUF1987 domain-containing protein [Bacteroidales bacterium]